MNVKISNELENHPSALSVFRLLGNERSSYEKDIAFIRKEMVCFGINELPLENVLVIVSTALHQEKNRISKQEYDIKVYKFSYAISTIFSELPENLFWRLYSSTISPISNKSVENLTIEKNFHPVSNPAINLNKLLESYRLFPDKGYGHGGFSIKYDEQDGNGEPILAKKWINIRGHYLNPNGPFKKEIVINIGVYTRIKVFGLCFENKTWNSFSYSDFEYLLRDCIPKFNEWIYYGSESFGDNFTVGKKFNDEYIEYVSNQLTGII